MGEADFAVNLETLGQVSSGVRDAVNSLTEMGDWNSEVGSSRGIGLEYALSNLDIGHDDLSAACEEFAEAWQPGLQHLIKDGGAAADQLDDARSTYAETDRDAAERLGQILAGGGEHGQ